MNYIIIIYKQVIRCFILVFLAFYLLSLNLGEY
jgi:hypothetical protein